MTRARVLLAVPVLALALGGCGGPDVTAGVMCEQLINQRVGVELVHDGPMEGATVEGDGPFVVRSAFTTPATGAITNYVCTVEEVAPDRWRLVDLATDR